MIDENGRKIEIHIYEGGQLNIASDNARIEAQQDNNLTTEADVEEFSKEIVGEDRHQPDTRLNEMFLSQYYSFIDDEIVSNISLNKDGQEKLLLKYENCMEFMKQRNLSCIQICGEGGTGKTCYLIKMAIYAVQSGEKAVYVRLNDINELEDSEKEAFLECKIQSQMQERNREDILKAENVFLLLDGFNEVRRPDRITLSKQIKKILNKENVRIIISSRGKVEGVVGLFGMMSFSMEKLQDQKIESYLNSHNIELRQAEKFWDLLSNPMMLTVYTKTNEELYYNRDIDYFRFYDEYQTKGELIANYLESLLAKRFMQMAGRTEMENELVILLYVMHFILPYVAYRLEQGKEYSIETDDLHQNIAEVLRRCDVNLEFLKGWFGKRGISDIAGLKRLDAAKVIEYLKDFSTVFYKQNNWRYVHHFFRDQLAASHIILECEQGIWKQEIPDVICKNVSEEVLGFVGELLGEYKKEQQKKKKDVLYSLLDLLRGKDAQEIHIALYHILQIWIRSGRNLAGEDFSKLDLKGQILAPYIQSYGGIIKTDFVDAVVYPENLLPVGHAGVVSHICYSPDGSILATASDDGFVCLWDAYTGFPLQRLENRVHSFVSGLEFSGDGELIACSCSQYTCVWEVRSGRQQFCLEGHDGEIISDIAFHPSGMEFVTGGQDGNICVWDMQTGNRLIHLNDGKPREEYCRNSMVLKYSLDGKYLAAGYEDGGIRIWNGSNGNAIYTLQVHTKEVRDISFSSDGKLLATADWDGIAVLWDVASGRQLKRLYGHQAGVFEIKFSPDNRIAATASWDKTIRVWDVKTGECLHILKEHEDVVQRVQFHPYKEYLVAAGCDGLVTIWSTDSGDLMHKLKIHKDIVGAIAFSPDGSLLATASVDENVCIWSTQSWNMLLFLKNNGRRINRLWITDDEKIFTVDYPEDTARQWDLNSQKCTWQKDHVSYELYICPDGNQYIDQIFENSLQMCDIEKNVVIWQREFEIGIRKFIHNIGKDEIILLLNSQKIIILDFKTGKTIDVLEEEVDNILLSLDGKYLAGSTPHDIFVWNCQDWDPVASYWKSSHGIQRRFAYFVDKSMVLRF